MIVGLITGLLIGFILGCLFAWWCLTKPLG